MKRILTAIIAIVVMGTGAFAHSTPNSNNTKKKESRTEIVTYLASLPDVSVTYLTKSMLKKLPTGKPESPLGVLLDKGDVKSIRVFELGNTEAEIAGKKLLDSYISEQNPILLIEPELLMLQNSGSSESIIYGIPFVNDIYRYSRILMYSKTQDKKAILIIISGSISESVIDELIDSFSS